ncbi:FDXHR family putative zinc-binding protein [Amycolatopsis speibonae]|uniref:Phage FDXHR zinc binding domain-containing protein n=1 Tax=Amycolatopsis speibonae TaxID=1450224 RepID=A0ABV7P4N0_9PSEU
MYGCRGCGRNFAGLGLFDKHRSPLGPHGTCLDPAGITNTAGKPVMELRDGVWSGPKLTKEQAAEIWKKKPTDPPVTV